VSDDDLDPDTARRIIAVQRLKPAQREHVFALLDAFVRDAKTAEAYAA
jgi:hypothetical protein